MMTNQSFAVPDKIESLKGWLRKGTKALDYFEVTKEVGVTSLDEGDGYVVWFYINGVLVNSFQNTSGDVLRKVIQECPDLWR